MQVQASALEIHDFATSSDPAKNLAVADAMNLLWVFSHHGRTTGCCSLYR